MKELIWDQTQDYATIEHIVVQLIYQNHPRMEEDEEEKHHEQNEDDLTECGIGVVEALVRVQDCGNDLILDLAKVELLHLEVIRDH